MVQADMHQNLQPSYRPFTLGNIVSGMERESKNDREVSEELIKKMWGGLSRILNQTGAHQFPKTLSIRARWVRTMKIWDLSGQKIH